MTESPRTAKPLAEPRARVRHSFVANLSAGARLDAVLISAVAALLGLRLYLYLTGFPQVGGKSFHIAHMLYGGLLMIVAVVILLAFIDRTGQWTGAILGGAGFGIFIDELGKFITRDINYFYRPAVSIMYVIFMVLYLATREIMDRQTITPEIALANGLETAKNVALHNASPADARRIEHYLQRADDANPIVDALHAEIRELAAAEQGEVHTLSVRIRWHYRQLLQSPVMQTAVVVTSVAVIALAFVIAIFETTVRLGTRASTLVEHGHLYVAGGVAFASCALVCAVVGVLVLPRSRRLGYRCLRIALLITIFLTQAFLFYYIQFVALFGLAADVIALVPLTSMLNRLRLQPRHS